LHFIDRQLPPIARLQVGIAEGADGRPGQLDDCMTYLGKHPSHLSLPAFGHDDF
jgi:hypothetical protein